MGSSSVFTGRALLRCRLEDVLGRQHHGAAAEAEDEPPERLALALADLVVRGLRVRPVRIVERPVARGDGVVRRSLKDGEVGRLLGDHGNRLYPGRARADDAYPHTREVDAFGRPGTRMMDRALEVVLARDVRRVPLPAWLGGAAL